MHCKDWSPLSQTIEQLAALTIIEGNQRNLDQGGIEGLWGTVVVCIADLRFAFVPNSKLTAERWMKAQDTVFWNRVYPKQAFEQGDNSESYYDPDRAEIEVAAGRYLQFQWLAHPLVDFAIVDSLVSSELCAFGEEAKAAPIFGLANNIIKAAAETRAKGDQSRLIWELLRARAIGFFWIYALPLGVFIWLGYVKAQRWAIVAAVCLGLLYLVRVVWKFLMNLYRRFFKIQDNYTRAVTLWAKMLGVHQALAGNVLSPTSIRSVIEETKQAGAGWSQTIDVILERRTRLSEAWIISPTMDGVIESTSPRRL